MTNILRETDMTRAYFNCPLCERQGTPGVPMTRDSHLFKCQFAHQLTQADLSKFKLTMNKMDELLTEQPAPTAVAWKIFVTPETRQAFEAKFAGRIHITMGTFLSALCADEIIFISGEDAGKLKQKGLGSGAAIIAALDSVDQLQKDRDAAIAKLTELTGMIRNSVGDGK